MSKKIKSSFSQWPKLSGSGVKVIPFPTVIQKKTASEFLKDITIEPSHSHKVSDYWPTALGVFIGLTYVSVLFLG